MDTKPQGTSAAPPRPAAARSEKQKLLELLDLIRQSPIEIRRLGRRNGKTDLRGRSCVISLEDVEEILGHGIERNAPRNWP